MASVTNDQVDSIDDTLFQLREYTLLHSLLQRYQAKRTWPDM
jgi:hypothetical protein